MTTPIQWVMLGAAMANTKVLATLKPERFEGALKGAIEAMQAKKAKAEQVEGKWVCPPIDRLLGCFSVGDHLLENENPIGAVQRIWDTLGSRELMVRKVDEIKERIHRIGLANKILTQEQLMEEVGKVAEEIVNIAKE